MDKPAKDAQAALDEYVKEKLPGLASADLAGLQQSVQNLDIKLRQINVNPPGTQINYIGGVGLVDRCQSCHVGTDPLVVPVVMTLTKADLGLAKSNDAPFTSHPDPDLLKFHPLEKFGCSPCHGGNGRALDTVEKAHGRYEHWLWPLYYPENYNAGCQQCHASDMRHRACAGAEHAPSSCIAKRAASAATSSRASTIRTSYWSPTRQQILAARQRQAGRPAGDPAPEQARRPGHQQRRRQPLITQTPPT